VLKSLAIYVHWPFCASKCPYCDFNSHVTDQEIDYNAWRMAYMNELRHIKEITGKRLVPSIFFGGGTPSLMPATLIENIICDIADIFTVSNNVEITLEANPTSIEQQKFIDFKMAGVNRVSIGVQSLHDDALKFLGRQHNGNEAIKALNIAQKTFDRYNFDLIYARPQQSIQDWQEELSTALTYAGNHLSLYQLTIEPGTPFYTQHARGDFRIPEADQGGEFYEITQQIMNQAGFGAYEVSNHARNIDHQSAHNLAYWRYEDYAGIGPGAHGRLSYGDKKYATRTHRAPDIWLSKALSHGHGYPPFDDIDIEDQKIERLMMGLRLYEGIALEHTEFLDQAKVDIMITQEYLTRSETHLSPTREGLQRLNSVLGYLL